MAALAIILPILIVLALLMLYINDTSSCWPFNYRIKIVSYLFDLPRGKWYDLECQHCGYTWRTRLSGMWFEECPVCHRKESHKRLYDTLALLKEKPDGR